MSYLYFPGCSLKGTGRAYEESVLSVFKALNIPLTELDDWNCCGATAYMSISELKAFALSARNLALAEQQTSGQDAVDLVAPCAACYLVLTKTQKYLAEFKEIGQKIHGALETAGLHYDGRVHIRHPLDVLVNDFGLEKIKAEVKQPLNGLKVASYYGCQIVRPYSTFDDQHTPVTMDNLMQALGAQVVDWPLKTRCCGGSLTGTIPDVGGRLSYILLKEALKRGANVVATACPLCQFNLECYQGLMRKSYDKDIRLSSLYFTQLLGKALGIDDRKLGMQRLFAPLKTQQVSRVSEGGQHART